MISCTPTHLKVNNANLHSVESAVISQLIKGEEGESGGGRGWRGEVKENAMSLSSADEDVIECHVLASAHQPASSPR